MVSGGGLGFFGEARGWGGNYPVVFVWKREEKLTSTFRNILFYFQVGFFFWGDLEKDWWFVCSYEESSQYGQIHELLPWFGKNLSVFAIKYQALHNNTYKNMDEVKFA